MEEKEIVNEHIDLHTIAVFRGKEYELQDLFNGLLEENIKLNNKIKQLKDNWQDLRSWIVMNSHNENTKESYLVVDYGKLLGKMFELNGGDNDENNKSKG